MTSITLLLSMRRLRHSFGCYRISWFLLRVTFILSALVFASAFYFRTTNLWALKNLGDTFLRKHIGRRPIVLNVHYRPAHESNGRSNLLVVLFLGDVLRTHELHCFSNKSVRNDDSAYDMHSRALVQRIHQGKRAASDICSWSGFVAECQVAEANIHSVRISTVGDSAKSIVVYPEPQFQPKEKRRHDLVVCIAPMYIYTDWAIMLLGIETWLALGATKIVVPIQSCTLSALRILQQYERDGLVVLRYWPKWPLLSDINPNGLILSRGIEESHVSCLHFVKPWADLVVFTDYDDFLLPMNPMDLQPNINLHIIQDQFRQHPQAGSLLFEHRDVQLRLPDFKTIANPPTLAAFNFSFLHNTEWKTVCRLVRMKTRVVVNASRVDSVNMHETGLHRFGYVQSRVPCRTAHFYHLRHSYSDIGVNEKRIDMGNLAAILNKNFADRLSSTFRDIVNEPLNASSVASFADFDMCMGRINEEHYSFRVSRCLTPHVCNPRLKKNVPCVAVTGHYEFAPAAQDYVIVLRNTSVVPSAPNCEAPLPVMTGNHYYMP